MGSPTHTPEVRERALLALAVTGGNSAQARRNLKDEGITVAERTLRDWRVTHAQRYSELHETHYQLIEQRLTQAQREIATRASVATEALVEQTITDAKAGKIKDPASAARNLATTAAIAVDKMLALTGRPTQITEHREPSKLIASLAAKGINVQIASPSHELPPRHVDVEVEVLSERP